ncbi:MAG TPA: PhzF family phenazine biosynthesis protein [Chryseosolibacter sp.]|nr:PhzF family phenazine biosynthesis protein [Chryseosolibacter sp.]
MNIEVNVLNSFSVNNSGGNPAGLVAPADHLSPAQKQYIASKAGLSETAFVSASKIADVKLEFFTPSKQIPHCGHATIATFSHLKKTGRITSTHSSKETIDGTRKILFSGEEAYMEQTAPRFFSVAEQEAIIRSLGITTHSLDARFHPVAGNTGNTFILVGVKDEQTLAMIKPDQKLIAGISEIYGAVGYYVFTTKASGFDAQARMFGPAYGIPEESATGMAAGPLACLLFENGMNKVNFVIGQGKYMDPPSESRINVKLNTGGNRVLDLTVGGNAYLAKTIVVEI